MNQDPDWYGALEGKDNRRLNAGPPSWQQAREFQSWNNHDFNHFRHGWDEAEENVGGGRVYGEYNKGPYKAGAEYNWDEQVGQPHGYTPGVWEALDMQATLQGFKKFDHKWHQFTTHQSIEKFSTPGNFVRRLKAIQKKTNLRKGRNLNFLGAFDALTSSVSGATGAVQGILNLFGKKSSESLVGQFQDRGFSHFNERTTITVTSGLPTKYFTSFMKDMLKSVVKVPSKHKDAVNQIVRWGLYTGANTWNAAENVFDIGSGGKVKNFIGKKIKHQSSKLILHLYPNISLH